jgi:hypothetical protein
MQEINNQADRLTQQLSKLGAVALGKILTALVELSNRERKAKSTKVTRKNTPEADMKSEFTVTRKDSENPNITPRQQAEEAIALLNSRLANLKTFNHEVDVNGTKYQLEKYQGGATAIKSEDSKLFTKQGKIRFAGDERKLIRDLPEIVARIDRELELEYPRQINNRTEVLYGYDANDRFIEKPLSQQDAQAILDLMEGKEGTTIKGGENLLIEYGGKKLFETDAQGIVTFSAYDRDPELLSSIKLKDEKGLTELRNYAKRMAATPDVVIKATRTASALIPDAPKETAKIAPQSPIGKTLNLAEPTAELDSHQTVSVAYDRVLKSEFATTQPNKRAQLTIEGVQFNLSPQKGKETRSILVTPSKGAKAVRIGRVDPDGNFKPDPKLNDPNVVRAIERVLAARGIEPQPVRETQQLELAARSKDPEYLSLTQENAPNPTLNINSPELATAGDAPGVNTPKPKPKTRNNTTEIAATAPGVSTSKSTPNIGNDPPELASAPANAPGVTVPTRGEKETVLVPTSGNNSERTQSEPEVSPNR